MRKYTVVYEWANGTGGDPGNWCAYFPDLPGCVASGDSLEETRTLIAEAIPFHIDGLKRRGSPVPEPSARAEEVEAGDAA